MYSLRNSEGLNSNLSTIVSKNITVLNNTTLNNLTVDTATLYVDSTNDKVGIGTTIPTEKLSVSGNISCVNLIGSGNVYSNYLNAPTSDINEINFTTINGNTANVDILNGTTINYTKANIPTVSSTTITTGTINSTYFNNTSDLSFTTNSTERMRVKSSNGYIGIGTTNPQSQLHISSGSANGTCGLILEADTSNTATETSTPFIKLTTDAGSTLSQINIEDSNYLLISNQSSTGLGGGLIFKTNVNSNALERMRIENNGNVGIGVSTPSKVLDITSTTGGFLPPRMSATQRDSIGTKVAGEIIYNTTTNKLQCWNGTLWNDLWL